MRGLGIVVAAIAVIGLTGESWAQSDCEATCPRAVYVRFVPRARSGDDRPHTKR